MRALLIHIGVTSSGAPRRREQRVRVDELKIGRAPSNDLALAGLNVSFHHATIHHGQARPLIESVGSAEVRINGHIEETSRLEPGDVIRIGRWDLHVAMPGPDQDLVLEIEEKELQTDELDGLQQRTKLGVGSGVFSARALTWLAVIVMLGLFLAAPLGFDWLKGSWSSGTIARKHSFIADECEKCHEVAFSRVANASCGACHGDVGNHTRAEARSEQMMNFRCASCHKDHNGDKRLISMDQPLCEMCHARIQDIYPASDLPGVSDFGSEHPIFRFDVITNPETGERARVKAGPQLRERSGLHFNHLRHVGQEATLPEGGRGTLDCGQCHQLDVAGLGMEPIDFERHCQSCHQLSFDAALPDAEALHGDPAKMRAELRALYSERVLSGRVTDARAPGTVRFMRPGKTLNQQESNIVSTWVRNRVARAEDHLMNEPGECSTCHDLRKGVASDGGTAVSPVAVSSNWLPGVSFAHRTHAPFPCRGCHPAAAVYDPADAPDSTRPEWSLSDAHPYGLLTPTELLDQHGITASETSEDILVPDRDQCRTCHQGTSAAPPAIASECILCHPFHRSEHGPMQTSEHARPVHRTLLVDSAAGSLPSDFHSAFFLPANRSVANVDSTTPRP